MTEKVINSRRKAVKLVNLDEFPDEAQALCDHCAQPWNCTGVCRKVAEVISKKARRH